MTDNVISHLNRVSIFSKFNPEDLARVAKLAKFCDYAAGDVIIREGERDGRLFILVEGRVDVVKNHGSERQKCLQTMGANCYFGEMALLDDFIRSASVVAQVPTRVIYLEHVNLIQAIVRNPNLALEMLQLMVRRIRALEQNMLNTLGTLLPICANCKKIRESDGHWTPVDAYITDHSDCDFSHGICPDCVQELYPELGGADEPNK